MPVYLLVDDSPTIRLVLRTTLRSLHAEGAQVLEAATEAEALALFMGREVDAVFLDMMLENDKTSLGALRAMLGARPDARVVLTTGLEREHPDVAEALGVGALAYLRKPLQREAIRDILVQIGAPRGRVGHIA